MPTKYSIEYTREFLRDAKRCRKRGLNMLLLEQVITILAETGTLPVQYDRISWVANTQDTGSVTYNPIGCLCGGKTIIC